MTDLKLEERISELELTVNCHIVEINQLQEKFLFVLQTLEINKLIRKIPMGNCNE